MGAQSADMTFFVTSVGSGKGADFGGLDGADRIARRSPQRPAPAARPGAPTSARRAPAPVNARDRIGNGPWQNAKGVVIAKNVEELHGANNNLTKQTALTEKGELSTAAATRRTSTTSSPARSPTAPLRRRRRQDLRQLDQERRRLRDGRPPRPHGPERRPAGEVVELLARLARLQRCRAGRDRRRGLLVLLRGEVMVAP